jgi:hypothetical protein
METIISNEAQAQELLALIPERFKEAFDIKAKYSETFGEYQINVGLCCASFLDLSKLKVFKELNTGYSECYAFKNDCTYLYLYLYRNDPTPHFHLAVL